MKCVVNCLMVLMFLPSLCYAGLFADDAKTETLANPPQLTIHIPYDKDLDANRFSQINFESLRWGRSTMQEKLYVKDKKEGSIFIERRTDNGSAGSGKIYNINYTLDKNKESMTVKFKPVSYKTYQEGLILPFAVPVFSEQDLFEYISKHNVYFSLDLNSPYNTESTYANFMRMAERVALAKGEKDPVTGKIFKDKFALNSKYGKVYFYLETFPYRNGSKALVHVAVPGSFTSDNEVDFRIIIKEIKTSLENIVNS